jgi:O-succinylbenzoate synthase
MRAFSIPMRTRFRQVDERAGVLLHGPAGWGEFSPFPDYPPRVCARWLAAAREAAEVAWPPPRRGFVPVNVTVPAVSPEQAHAIVAASGCSTAKVKVAEAGETLACDVDRVEAVRDALGPGGRVRVDANGGWDVAAALAAIRALDRFDLEYVEQPCPTLEDMAALRRSVDVPLAADESVRTADDPLRVAGLEAADVVVLKVQPLGGVWPALRVAEAAGLPVVVSSALETSVGLAAGLALAAALPDLPYACGLGTALLLHGDVVAEPLVPVGGLLEVRRPAVDEERLAAHELTGARAAAWFERLRAAREAEA